MSGSAPHAPRHAIVVGYDGSQAADRAIAHAARVATGAAKRLVVVFGSGSLEEQERHGRAVLDRLSSERGEQLRGVEYETEIRPEPAADALLEAARAHDAEEIVVGTRGFGDARTWLGSVSQELLRIADRPVVVVPPPERSVARPAMRTVEPHPHRHPSRYGTPS